MCVHRWMQLELIDALYQSTLMIHYTYIMIVRELIYHRKETTRRNSGNWKRRVDSGFGGSGGAGKYLRFVEK